MDVRPADQRRAMPMSAKPNARRRADRIMTTGAAPNANERAREFEWLYGPAKTRGPLPMMDLSVPDGPAFTKANGDTSAKTKLNAAVVIATSPRVDTTRRGGETSQKVTPINGKIRNCLPDTYPAPTAEMTWMATQGARNAISRQILVAGADCM
jgi:hypothetical protein